MISDLDPEFVPTLVSIRDRIRTSPAAMGLVVGIGVFAVRRTLFGDSRLHALFSSAMMGIAVTTGMTATSRARLEASSTVREGAASLC